MRGVVKSVEGHSITLELDAVITFKENDDVDVEVKLHKDKRSLNANAYFHVLVNEIARATNISDDECKYKMVIEYGTIAKNEDGTPVTIKIPKHTDILQFYKYAKWYGEKDNFDFYIFYKPTHTLDTKEMAKLIDGVVSECKELDIQTLDEIKTKKLIDDWSK